MAGIIQSQMGQVKFKVDLPRGLIHPGRQVSFIFARRTDLRAGSKSADVLPRPPSVDGSALLAEENIVGEHNTKPNIVVVVVRVVPVANRASGVVSIVVPRPAAHNTRSHDLSRL